MLRKLKIKFVVINMAIVSLMLGVILGLVYHSTQQNLEQESIAMMRSIAANPIRPGLPNELSGQVKLPFFTLELNDFDELLSADGGYYDLSDERLLQTMIELAVRSGTQVGTLETYHLRFFRSASPMGRIIVFADMSSELATLQNLLRTCVAIGALGFLGFLCISIALAQWAVRPVDRAWRQQKQFVADASHELKTPLTVITTNAELLKSPEYDAASKERFAGGILEVATHMRTLLEQMLQLARSDSDQNRLRADKLDFSRLITELAFTYESVLYEKGLSLQYEIEPACQIAGDRHLLTQVLDILLDNAGKYSHPESTVTIELKKLRWGRCRLSVANRGDPIGKEDRKNIFERFYRADSARPYNGSFGLGLSIAQNIVTLHKGRIWVESADGVNTFLVELPML